MKLGDSKHEVPIIPGALRELSRTGLLKRALEFFVAKCRAQGLYIGVSSDIHHLSDQTVAIPKRSLRRLPPDVLAGEGCQVHGAILHGRRPGRCCDHSRVTAPSRTASRTDSGDDSRSTGRGANASSFSSRRTFHTMPSGTPMRTTAGIEGGTFPFIGGRDTDGGALADRRAPIRRGTRELLAELSAMFARKRSTLAGIS